GRAVLDLALDRLQGRPHTRARGLVHAAGVLEGAGLVRRGDAVLIAGGGAVVAHDRPALLVPGGPPPERGPGPACGALSPPPPPAEDETHRKQEHDADGKPPGDRATPSSAWHDLTFLDAPGGWPGAEEPPTGLPRWEALRQQLGGTGQGGGARAGQ